MSGAAGRLARAISIRCWLCLTLLVVAGLSGPSTGAEQPLAGLLERGRDLAVAKCGRCHAVDRTDESPHDITPPFRDLHERFPIAMLEEAPERESITGHDEMPGFDLDAEDIRALLAYIDSLAPPSSPRYLDRKVR